MNTSDDTPADGAGGWRLGTHRVSRDDAAALRRVKDMVRERFSLTDDDTLVVREVDGRAPGFPPRETVITFETAADGTRHHYTVFKKALEVTADDLPPAWMKSALVVDGNFACSCC